MDYIIDTEEFLTKNRGARAQSRRNKALKRIKDRQLAGLFFNLSEADNPCDVEDYLHWQHFYNVAARCWDYCPDILDKPRRRYSIHEDYVDRPVKVVTVTHITIVEERWY